MTDRLALKPDEADLMTAAEIAEVLSMDQSHVYQLIKRGMRHVRVGRSVRVPRREFLRWLSDRMQEPKPRSVKPLKVVPKLSKGGAGVRPSELNQKRRTG